MDYRSKNSYDNAQKTSYKPVAVTDATKVKSNGSPVVTDEKYRHFTTMYALLWLAVSLPYVVSKVAPTVSGLEFFGLLLFPLYILAVVYAPLHLLHLVPYMKSSTPSTGWKLCALVINVLNVLMLVRLLVAFVARV